MPEFKPHLSSSAKILKECIDSTGVQKAEGGSRLYMPNGLSTDLLFNLEETMSSPAALSAAADCVLDIISDIEDSLPETAHFDAVCATDKGAGVAAALAIRSFDLGNDAPILSVEHGVYARVVGTSGVVTGSKVLLLTGAVSTGRTVLRDATALREAGYVVTDCICIVKREEEGQQRLLENGVDLHEIFDIAHFRK